MLASPAHRRLARPTLLLVGMVLLAAPASATAVKSPATPATLESATALAMQGRFAEAKREYARVAREQRRGGTLPVEALWRLAQMHHGEGKLRSAAHVLRSLAFEASVEGDLETQARALLEATLLFHALGADAEVRRGVQQLQQLRRSPHLGPALRDSIDQRLGLS